MDRTAAFQKLRLVLVGRLDALKRALAGELSTLRERKTNLTPGDTSDEALVLVEQETNSQLAEAESREITRIELALAHMKSGQYGVCEACKQNIKMVRLNALPCATHCVKCQREVERGVVLAEISTGQESNPSGREDE